ncbi:PREDICTED: scarecrow-like protein 33 [Camelina sativa]|uniref:Scarecrow-like protein 33 n=1 Tax=Camelina sativa TaxID=90675 RepID=A0ABM0SQ11_CAMSA|nr:PREDICTED: scarecrow-like protein 33 [Camelina sativa]
MGSYSAGFPESLDWFDFPGLGNGLYLNDQPLLDTGCVPPLPPEPPSYSQQNLASADADFSDSVLKYISQVLMEEDMEDKPCMFHDALSLQAAEKSLYEALGEKYPGDYDSSQPLITTTRPAPLVSSPGGSSYTSSITTTSSDSQWSFDCLENNRPSSWLQTPIPNNFVFQSTSTRSSPSPQSVVFGSGLSNDLVSNMFNDKDMALQFKKGMEEASKFLPKSSQLVIDVENYIPALGSKEKNNSVPYRLTGKKSQLREDEDSDEERSKKQAAVYVDEAELTEMFDKVLIFGEPKEPPVCILQESFQKEPEKASSVSKSHKGEKPAANDKETPDLRTMLVSCAQAVSINDRRTADDLLTRIRQYSSSYGDGTERLAHYFANSLEARLAGIGTQVYTALSSKKTSASDMLKAYQTYISVCPFKKIAIIFANHSIMRLASTANAKTIHIIDFGISYGFQWPSLIHRLAWRRGSSCKLRITGIELPQRGFRPAEGVIETGRRLAKYCQKFNIPFEYNAIAQKWDTIKLEDLKLKEGEFVAVNSLFRFRNLLDETVAVHSPRDAVLKLIRKIKPDVFMPAILSGSYNAPFFVTRFREVLFHYSSLFDMCDTNLTRDDPMRVMFEKEFYGREIMNVVACEGTERVERPESYKQWQARAMRAGFRQIPLDKDLVQKLKLLVENGYKTKEFDVDQDCNWLLQGWKGRIVYASSIWVPL